MLHMGRFVSVIESTVARSYCAGERRSRSFDGKGDTQRLIKLGQFHEPETADIISKHGFRDAGKSVGMDRTFAFQPFSNSDGDFRGEAEPAGVNRRADHGGKSCIDEVLAAYNSKHALLLGILSRLAHEVEVAPLHGST